MKKFAICATTVMMMFACMPVSFAAERTPITASAPTPLEPVEAQILIARLNEMKAIDKQDVSAAQWEALKQEKKAIKKKLRGGGIYLSVGALLVIVILLVLLL